MEIISALCVVLALVILFIVCVVCYVTNKDSKQAEITRVEEEKARLYEERTIKYNEACKKYNEMLEQNSSSFVDCLVDAIKNKTPDISKAACVYVHLKHLHIECLKTIDMCIMLYDAEIYYGKFINSILPNSSASRSMNITIDDATQMISNRADYLYRKTLIDGYVSEGCTKAEAIQLAEQKLHNEEMERQSREAIELQKAHSKKISQEVANLQSKLSDLNQEQRRTSNMAAWAAFTNIMGK